MKKHTLFLLTLSLAAFGCDDESDSGSGTDAAVSGQDASTVRLDGSVIRMDAATQRMDASTQRMDMGFNPPPTGLSSCDDANLVACFSNYDCQDEFEVCLNVGTAEESVPCCYAGDVGQKSVGETCSPTIGESECESSICISGDTGTFCSDRCETVEDCPANMQECIPIAFSGDDSSWCFPSNGE